jgi:hypothetical protein
MNIDLSVYTQVEDVARPIDLSQFDSGVCLISDTCPDSRRLASQLAGHSIKILYIEDGMEYVFIKENFQATGKTYSIKEKETKEYVPVLYLKKQNKYYGTWTTHHGTEVEFKKSRVYAINKESSTLKL